ncbi:hypothetical protein [Sphingobacterium rhinopitheci]|uniref:hypothetical protein n=1 Tax=Sphingobacterium rhinopitheci TaxID=2781960 RepID=UPI001F523639|nr:hypothetical protein [Sphingobacterium rhinopitheci]MCI0922602.1 hypothetical protein [Sphingobacterium rhinopitheci]
MKKAVLILTVVTGLSLTSKAQELSSFKKKDLFLEGNFNTTINNDNDFGHKRTIVNFNPKVGAFVADKFALGLKFNVSSDASKINNFHYGQSSVNINYYGIGVFGRYYFLELGNRFKTYTEIGGNYSSGKRKRSGTNLEVSNKLHNYNLDATIGANYFLTNRIAINFAFANIIGFNSSKDDGLGGNSINSFHVNLNNFNNFFQSAQFGLTFKI